MKPAKISIRIAAVLLMIALYFSGKAQSSLLVAHSLQNAKKIADTVAMGFKTPYQYYKTDTLPKHGFAVVRYRNPTNAEDKLNIVFSYFKDQPLYLQSVDGSLADLMAFYKRFKPGLTAHEMTEKAGDKTLVETEKGRREIRLHNEADHWEIDIDAL